VDVNYQNKMPLVNFLDSMLGIGTFLLHICLIVFFSSYIYYRVTKKIPSLFEGAWEFIKDNSLTLAFLMTFGATIISLIYSEIIGYEACVLCWYQRTLIYPQVIILGVALLKKRKDIFDFVVGLNVIGFVIALYQYSLQRFNISGNCGSAGIACNSIYVFELGYITIPMASLTLFVSVIILTYIWKKG